MEPVHGRALLLASLAAAVAAPASARAVAFAPLEQCTAGFPRGTGADALPEGIGAVPSGRRNGHLWAHASGYVHAPLSTVWAALQDPAVSRLRTVEGRVIPEGDPAAPLGFRVAYHARAFVFDVSWEVAYRGGPLAGSLDRLDAPGAAIGFRWDKSAGTTHIRVLSASLVAREAAPGVTALELVGWLDADRTGKRDAEQMVTEWFGRIAARVHGGDRGAQARARP